MDNRTTTVSQLFDHGPSDSEFPFSFNNIAASNDNLFDTLCYCRIEKGAFTPKASRWKVDGRQSSSVSVLLPTVVITAPSVSEGKVGDSEAGIDSTAEFRGLMQSVIHDSKHLARPLYHRHSCLCSAGAGRWRFSFSDNPRQAEVCLSSPSFREEEIWL